MESFEFLEEHLWNPLGYLGFTNDFLKINKHTIIDTWIVLGVLSTIIIIARYFLAQNNRTAQYFLTSFVQNFKDLTTQSFGTFIYKHFAFITSLFIFILCCNWISLIPFVEEPTKDLNTALAIGLSAFFYKEFFAIKAHGFKGYLSEFFHPFFLMFPLNVIGHFSKVISISFRLFGNIFGGFIISSLYTHALSSSFIFEILGLLSGINYIVLLFFVIFEGLIQAFVFTMLSLTYLALATQESEPGEFN